MSQVDWLRIVGLHPLDPELRRGAPIATPVDYLQLLKGTLVGLVRMMLWRKITIRRAAHEIRAGGGVRSYGALVKATGLTWGWLGPVEAPIEAVRDLARYVDDSVREYGRVGTVTPLARAMRRVAEFTGGVTLIVTDIDHANDLSGSGKTISVLYLACLPYLVWAAGARRRSRRTVGVQRDDALEFCLNTAYAHGLITTTQLGAGYILAKAAAVGELGGAVPFIVIDNADVLIPRERGYSHLLRVAKRVLTMQRGIIGHVFLVAKRIETLPTPLLSLVGRVGMVHFLPQRDTIVVRWFKPLGPTSHRTLALTPVYHAWAEEDPTSQVATFVGENYIHRIMQSWAYRRLEEDRKLTLTIWLTKEKP